MTDAPQDEVLEVSTPAQFKAMGHPLRQRLMFVLGEAATISQLAARLPAAKGSVAHHLKVLQEAGMVRVVRTRQVRGGTEQYYRRSAARLDITPRAAEPTAAMLNAVAQEVTKAADDPLLILRHVRLNAEQAERLRDTLHQLATEIEPAGEEADRYGMLVTMYREHR